MSKAITTKFLSATNFKGSRIKATDGDNSITLGYSHETRHENRHAEVAAALVLKMHEKAKGGWLGVYVAGHGKDGNVFVKLPGSFSREWCEKYLCGFEGSDWFFLSSSGERSTVFGKDD